MLFCGPAWNEADNKGGRQFSRRESTLQHEAPLGIRTGEQPGFITEGPVLMQQTASTHTSTSTM